MDNEEYKIQLERDITNVNQIIEAFAETQWYLISNETGYAYIKKVIDFLSINVELINKEQLTLIMEKVHGEIDPILRKKLFQKSIEYDVVFLSPYQIKFGELDNDEKVKYLQLLNRHNYRDFYYSGIRDRDTNYYNTYFSLTNDEKKQGITTKDKPCENMNLEILKNKPQLFFNNEFFSVEEKKAVFNRFIESNESSSSCWFLLNAIASNEIDIKINNILESILNNIISNQSEHEQKKNIMYLFNSFEKNEELTKDTIQIINETPDIRVVIEKILSKKIKLPKDYDIENFKNKYEEYEKMNYMQYMILNKENKFLAELCKNNKTFFNILNHSLHHNVNEFNYEVNPLDLLIKENKKNSAIENIYTHKIINNNLNPSVKDKVCVILFKSLIPYDKRETAKNASVFNAISLMPINIINKYLARFEGRMSSEVLEEIKIVRNMVKLDKETAKRKLMQSFNNNQTEEFKVKKNKI